MQPIAHLSLPVIDLEGALDFYVTTLGCTTGRASDEVADVWFFGTQLTLHQRPEQVLSDPGVRHFGATIDAVALAAVEARLAATDLAWLRPPTSKGVGTPKEERKALIADPSGNVIELKSYANPAAAFEHPGLGDQTVSSSS